MSHLADNGSDGFVVAGTTGEASTLTDEEQLGLIELAVPERPPGKSIIAGTGTNDTRQVVLPDRTRDRAGRRRDAVGHARTTTARAGSGCCRHYEAAAAATDKPTILYNIPGRTGTNMPPDLLAELAQIQGIEAVKQANADELQLIDGLDLYAGDDGTLARTLDMGGAGGILVASHIVGNEMRRMVDEPERRAEIDASLARCLRDAVHHLQPDLHQGGAEHARPRSRGAAAAAGGGHRRGVERSRAMLERHGLLAGAPA